MRKHIYLHTSNLNNIKDFKDDECFEPYYMYCHEIKHMNPCEWGRIKTGDYYYHIMLGTIWTQIPECAWCKTELILKKISNPNGTAMTCLEYVIYALECPKCRSRGPLFNVNRFIENDETAMQEIKNRLHAQYDNRLAWDHDLKNPYEKYY